VNGTIVTMAAGGAAKLSRESRLRNDAIMMTGTRLCLGLQQWHRLRNITARGGEKDLEHSEEAGSVADLQDLAVQQAVQLAIKTGIVANTP
jgi:hypothetical protein